MTKAFLWFYGHSNTYWNIQKQKKKQNSLFPKSGKRHFNFTHPHEANVLLASEKCCVFILTKLALVLLLSSSGMGRKTAKATQFAKMVSKMMISKVLDGETQDHDNR